jgi:hypothetical protein
VTGAAAAGWFGRLAGAVGAGPTLAVLAVGGLVVGELGGATAGGVFSVTVDLYAVPFGTCEPGRSSPEEGRC